MGSTLLQHATLGKADHFGTYASLVSFDNGNSGASKTIDAANGGMQKITLTAATPALTLTVPTGSLAKDLVLRVIQDGTGSRVPSWVNVKWPNGVMPTGSSTASAEDIYSFVWDVGAAHWRGVLAGANFG